LGRLEIILRYRQRMTRPAPARGRGSLPWLAALLGFVVALPAHGVTLREVLLKNNIALTPDGPSGLDRPITSYAVENRKDLFAVAFYWLLDGPPVFPDHFQVSLLDKRSGSWTHAVLPREQEITSAAGPSWNLGSLMKITPTRHYLYLDTHNTPSAGIVLVLTKRLRPVAALAGWIVKLLPHEMVLYHRDMPHFAPTHSAELWLYDPRSGRDVKLYPTKPYQPIRRQYIEQVRKIYAALGEEWFMIHNHHMDPERFDSSLEEPITVSRNGTVVSFGMLFGTPPLSPASTPELDLIVTCRNILSAKPRCTEAKLAAAEAQRLHR
jgi:hypothetical protein